MRLARSVADHGSTAGHAGRDSGSRVSDRPGRQGEVWITVEKAMAPPPSAKFGFRVPPGAWLVADMVDAHFEAASFDAVVALFSFTHVPRRHYAGLLAHMRGWLRPHGRLLVTFGVSDSPGWREEDLLGLGAENWTNS